MSASQGSKKIVAGIFALVTWIAIAAAVHFGSGEEVSLPIAALIGAVPAIAIGFIIASLKKKEKSAPVPKVKVQPQAASTRAVSEEKIAPLLNEGMDQVRPIGEQTAFFGSIGQLAKEEEAEREAEEKGKHEKKDFYKKVQTEDDEPVKID